MGEEMGQGPPELTSLPKHSNVNLPPQPQRPARGSPSPKAGEGAACSPIEEDLGQFEDFLAGFHAGGAEMGLHGLDAPAQVPGRLLPPAWAKGKGGPEPSRGREGGSYFLTQRVGYTANKRQSKPQGVLDLPPFL